MVRKEVGPVPERGFFNLKKNHNMFYDEDDESFDLDLEDLDLQDIPYVSYKNLHQYYREALLKVNPNDLHKIRTPTYWEIHDRYYWYVTKNVKRMRLFLHAYISYTKNQSLDWSVIKRREKEERPVKEKSTTGMTITLYDPHWPQSFSQERLRKLYNRPLHKKLKSKK